MLLWPENSNMFIKVYFGSSLVNFHKSVSFLFWHVRKTHLFKKFASARTYFLDQTSKPFQVKSKNIINPLLTRIACLPIIEKLLLWPCHNSLIALRLNLCCLTLKHECIFDQFHIERHEMECA